MTESYSKDQIKGVNKQIAKKMIEIVESLRNDPCLGDPYVSCELITQLFVLFMKSMKSDGKCAGFTYEEVSGILEEVSSDILKYYKLGI